MLEIEHNIPIPTRGRQTSSIVATLRLMKPGDSFVVPADSQRQTIVTAANRHGFKITISKDHPSVKGTGLWRVWLLERLERPSK